MVLTAACAGGAAQDTSPSPWSAWARVPDDQDILGGSDRQQIDGIVAGGPGLVAVGRDLSAGEGGAAAVWTSPDGITWTRVPHDEAVFGGPNWEYMWAVAVGGPGLVAVGVDSPGGTDRDAAVWTSPDGVTWARVPDDEAVFGGRRQQVMEAVVAGGPGLVAVGYDEGAGDREDGGGWAKDAAVWTSPDGITWTRVPHDEAVFGGPNSQRMNGIVAGGPGLVAVGYDNSAAGWAGANSNAAVWTSPDGLTWTRVPDSEVFGDYRWQTMTAVAAGGPGLVAVGYDGIATNHDAAVWTSPDGVIWARVPHDEAVFGGPEAQAMNAVVAAGPGLVAVGYAGVVNDPDTAVWTSPDGATWTRVPHDAGVFGGLDSEWMNGLVAGGPGLVAVGYSTASRGWVGVDTDAMVWVSPPG